MAQCRKVSPLQVLSGRDGSAPRTAGSRGVYEAVRDTEDIVAQSRHKFPFLGLGHVAKCKIPHLSYLTTPRLADAPESDLC